MRDFRDAKSMAHELREVLATKHLQITNSESLEIIARLFGISDWNTLSALIKRPSQEPGPIEPPTKVQGPHFADSTEAALHGALRAAHERFHIECTVEHLLLALTEVPEVTALLKGRGIDPAKFNESLKRSSEIATPGDRGSHGDPVPSAAFQRVVQRAILNAQSSRKWNITAADLLVAILAEQEGAGVRLLREHGLDRGSG